MHIKREKKKQMVDSSTSTMEEEKVPERRRKLQIPNPINESQEVIGSKSSSESEDEQIPNVFNNQNLLNPPTSQELS